MSTPLLHRWARRLSLHGWRGASVYWAIAERLHPIPARSLVKVGPSCEVLIRTDDWIGQNVYRGLYERSELLLLPSLITAGGVAVDIGANIGYYTAAMSCLAGPHGFVVAVEPIHSIYQDLVATVESLPFSNVELHRAAVGDAIGSVTVALPDASNRGAGTLRPSESAARELVDMVTVDHLLFERIGQEVDLVKIDVEGWEPAVLRSMRSLLATCRVRHILLEVSPEFGILSDVVAELARISADYRFYVVSESGAWRRTLTLAPVSPTDLALRTRQCNLLICRRDCADHLTLHGRREP